MSEYKLTNISIEYEYGHPKGISVCLENGLDEERWRHLVLLKDGEELTPHNAADGLKCLADWIEWKFVRTRNINNDWRVE